MMRRIITLRIILLLASGFTCPAFAEPTPVIRTEISPRQVVVGQTVTLRIDILVPTWFTAPIDYPSTFTLPGATAQLSNAAATNLTEQIDHQSYAGMSRSYTVVAGKAGEFKLPALPIKVSYSVDGKPRTLTLQTAPQRLLATLPSGAEGLGYFFASPNYSLKQSLDRSLNKLRVGDAIVRRISQRAESVAAMNLPGLVFAELDGVSIYPAEAQLNDTGGERGSVRVGERIDSVTYVLRKQGRQELPGLKVGYFDTLAGKMRWASVPALFFEVAADPHAAASIKPSALPNDGVSPAPTDKFSLRKMLLNFWRHPATLPSMAVLAIVILLVYGLRRRGINPARLVRAWQQERHNSETAHFRRCLASLQQATPTQTLNATMRWLYQLKRAGGSASLTRFAATFGDDDFRQRVEQLQNHLFASSERTKNDTDSKLRHSGLAKSERNPKHRHSGEGRNPEAAPHQLIAITPNPDIRQSDGWEVKWHAASYRSALIKARQRWLQTQKISRATSVTLATLNPTLSFDKS